MLPVKLWLIRHGETNINTGLWAINPNDAQLTPLGIDQAKSAAARIVDRPDCFISSPLRRAQETSQWITAQWPEAPLITLPIQEFIYLSTQRLNEMTPLARKAKINAYWLRNDPLYCDGDNAESFASFMQRVLAFYSYLNELDGYIIVIGHGQFFKAFQLGLTLGFEINKQWMYLYRQAETTNPIKNGEIIQLKRNELKGF